MTEIVVLVGEIGGDEEEKARAVHRRPHDEAGARVHRRLLGAAPARRWATRGAIISGSSGTCRREEGSARGPWAIDVGATPTEVAQLVAKRF